MSQVTVVSVFVIRLLSVTHLVHSNNNKKKTLHQGLKLSLPCVSFQVLDRLILYLRVVHSIDYYNTCEYPSEDEMPNRCGMIHVRGPIPPNRITHGEGQFG